MNYYINPANLTSVFMLPCSVADSYLKFAKAEHIKVLIFIMRNMSAKINESEIAEKCGIEEYDVKEALLYWADTGILLPKQSDKTVSKTAEKTVKKTDKPTRSDVAKRGDDPKIRYLLRETQVKLGRNLKSNEASTLVWLYDDEGLDVSLILLIIQYAVAHNKANIRFIESVACDWVEKGINDITSADEELRKMAIGEQAWGIVSRAFGIERRKPSKKETDLSYKWINEWNITPEMLEEAYEECVNQKSKFSFPYVAKIIENWHKGITGTDGKTTTNKKANEKSNFAAYDMDEFEKMLTSKE